MRHVYCVTSFSRITLAAKNVHVHVSCFAIDPKLISVVTGGGRAWTGHSSQGDECVLITVERAHCVFYVWAPSALRISWMLSVSTFLSSMTSRSIWLTVTLSYALVLRLRHVLKLLRMVASFAFAPFFTFRSQLLGKLLHFLIVRQVLERQFV